MFADAGLLSAAVSKACQLSLSISYLSSRPQPPALSLSDQSVANPGSRRRVAAVSAVAKSPAASSATFDIVGKRQHVYLADARQPCNRVVVNEDDLIHHPLRYLLNPAPRLREVARQYASDYVYRPGNDIERIAKYTAEDVGKDAQHLQYRPIYLLPQLGNALDYVSQ